MAQNQPQHIMDAGGGQTGSPAAHSSPVGPSTPPVMSGSIPVPSRSASAGLSFGTDLGHLLCDSSSGWSASTTSPPNIPRNFIHSQVGHQTLPPQMPVHQQPPLPQNTLFIDEIIPYLPRSLWDNPADRFHLLQSLANLSLDQQQHLLLVLQQQWVENQQQQLQQQTHSSIGLGVDPSLQRPCNVPSTLQNMDAPDIALPSLRSFSVSQDTFQAGLSSSSDLDGIGGPLHRSSSDLGSRIHSFHLDLGNLTNNVRTSVDDENPMQSVFSHHQQLGQLPMPSNFPPSSASFPHNSCSSGTHLGSAMDTAPLTSLQSNLDQGKLINLNQELSGLYVEDLQRAPGTPLSQTPPPKVVADPGSICFQNGSLNGDADGRNKSPQNNGAHAASNSSYAATASKSKKNKKNNKNSTESQNKKSQHVSGNDNPASKGSDDAVASSHDQSVGVAAATPQQFSFYSTDQNIFLEKMGSLSSSIVNWISRDKVKPRKTSAGDVSDDCATAAHKTDVQNSSNKGGQNASGYSSFVPCSFVNPNTRTAHNKSLNSNKLSYSDVLSSSKAASEASSSKALSGFVHAGPRTNNFTESPATGNNVPLMQNHIVQNPSKKTKNNSVFSSSPSLTAKSKKASNPFFSSRVGLDEFVHPTVEELASSSRLLDTFNSTPYSTSDKKSTSPNARSKKSEASSYNTEESEEEAAASTQGQTSSKQKTKSPSASAATLLNNNNKIFNQKQNLKKSSFINNLCEAASSASSVSPTGASEQQDNKQPPQQPASDAAPAAARSEESSSEDDSSQPSASTHTLSSESPPSPSWLSKNSGGAGSVVSLKSRSSFNNTSNNNNNNNNVSKGSGGGSRNKGSSKKRKEQNDWSALAAGVLQLCWRYVLLACKWLYDLVAEVILMSSSLFWHGWTKVLSFVRVYGSVGLGGLRDGWAYLVDRLDRLCRPKGSKKRLRDAASATHYLEQNIVLPSTGDEAMKRLLACRGLNNYSILGVTPQASQEDIRRYYRRQAFLVHPDKNKTPGAEEAFKVLGHAFEEIGEPAKREAYDKRLLGESQLGEAWDKLADLLKELERKLEESANLICCTSCPNKHKRIKVPDRPLYAARYCEQCNIRHGAKEGDIWAESRYYGLRWRYYACMEGAVYDITEWASCQAGNLKQLRANTHTVQYRIVAGKKKGQQQQRGQQQQQQHASDLPTDPEIEEFFNQLYREKFSQHFPPPSSSSPPTSPSHSAAAPPGNPHGGDSGAAGPRRRGDKVNRRQRRQ